MRDVMKLAGTRILVTGATGFIGSHLLARLCEVGADVHTVSRARQLQRGLPVRWHQGNLADLATTRILLETIRPRVIYHLAGHVVGARGAEAILPTLHSNLMSTVNLLTVAHAMGCDRFILPGSLEEPSSGQNEVVPSSPYAVTKWASTAYARMFHALYQFPAVILRVFMVYGPGQHDRKKLIPYVIDSLLKEEVPELTSGQRAVDWVYVDEVVDALLASAVAHNVEGRTIDIGSGKTETVRAVVQMLARLMESDLAPSFSSRPDRPLEQVRVADIHAAEKFLHWVPKVSLEEGLKRTIAWYADNPHRSSRPQAISTT